MANFDCDIPKRYLGGARKFTISADDAAMAHAVVAALESKDPSTQVGACIYNENDSNIATGCNQAPEGWEEENFPYGKEAEDESYWKYPYIKHAEQACIDNAILGKHITKDELSKCSMAVTLFPCLECARRIVNSGIKRIIYLERRPNTKNPNEDKQIDILFKAMKVVTCRYSKFKSILGLEINYNDEKKDSCGYGRVLRKTS